MENLNKGSVIIKLVHYLPFLLHLLYLCLALFLSISALFGLSFCSFELFTYSLSFSAITRLIAFQGCRIIGLLSNFERDKYGNELRDRLARHGALETVTRAMGAHLVCVLRVCVCVCVCASIFSCACACACACVCVCVCVSMCPCLCLWRQLSANQLCISPQHVRSSARARMLPLSLPPNSLSLILCACKYVCVYVSMFSYSQQ